MRVGSETTKVPEAQDDFMVERAFASGMKTDDRVFAVIANARVRPSNLVQVHTIILRNRSEFSSSPYLTIVTKKKGCPKAAPFSNHW